MIKRVFLIAGLMALALLAASWLFELPPVLDQQELSTSRQGLKSVPEAQALTPYRIGQGRHFCLPRIFRTRRRPERVSWLVVFEENCAYDLGDEDQKDWNKLLGLFYNLFDPLDNTAMVGWRWNLDTERMELNAYYHIDGNREFTRPLLDVPLREPVRIDLLVDYERKTYTTVLKRLDDGKQATHRQTFAHDRTRCYEINTYFGGNEASPQAVTVRKGYVE